MKSLISLCFFFIISAPVYSQVRVAFIEGFTPQGRVQLEPGSTYYHIALQIADGRWHHCYPRIGSVLVNNLPPALGMATQVLENYEMPLVSFSDIEPFLGQPFDPLYGFKSTATSYCSKRIGQQLAIPPKHRMKFEADMWNKVKGVKKNQKGWSPDYIFNYLLSERGFRPMVPFTTRARINLGALPKPLPHIALSNVRTCKGLLR